MTAKNDKSDIFIRNGLKGSQDSAPRMLHAHNGLPCRRPSGLIALRIL